MSHDPSILEEANKLWEEFKLLDSEAFVQHDRWQLMERMARYSEARKAQERYEAAVERSKEIVNKMIKLANMVRPRTGRKPWDIYSAHTMILKAFGMKD